MRVGLLDGVVGNFVYYMSAWRDDWTTRNQCVERVAAVCSEHCCWLHELGCLQPPSAEYYTVDDKVFSDPRRLDVVAGRVRWDACSRRGDGVLRGRAVARVDRECLHCGSSLPQNCRVKVRVSASMLAATDTQFIGTTEHDIVVCTSQGNNNKLNKW